MHICIPDHLLDYLFQAGLGGLSFDEGQFSVFGYVIIYFYRLHLHIYFVSIKLMFIHYIIFLNIKVCHWRKRRTFPDKIWRCNTISQNCGRVRPSNNSNHQLNIFSWNLIFRVIYHSNRTFVVLFHTFTY